MRAFPSLTLAALLAAAGLSSAPAGAQPPEPSPVRGLATPQLLDRAVGRGELSRGRADLLLAYAFADPDRLPERFRSDEPWDGTLPLLGLRARLERAPRSAERSEALDLLAAPSNDCAGSVGNLPDSRTTAHFWVQYKAGTIGGGLTIDSYATSLETAWAAEVTTFGWPAPPLPTTPGGARYHVAIRGLSGGLYGYVSSSGTYAGLTGDNANTPWDDRNAHASCMVLNADYSAFPSTPQASLDSTTAHEFAHSLQYGLGALHVPDGADPNTAPDSVNTDAVFTEGIATWMEDEVFDGANDNYNYLWPSFSTSMGHYTVSPYPYWIAWRGITERYGTGVAGGGEDVMQAFWERISRDDNWNVLTAMQAAVATRGSSLADAFHAYAIAVRFNRACTGGYVLPHCFEEGPAYLSADPAIPTHGAIATAGGSFTGSVADDYALNWVSLPSVGPYGIRLSNTSNGGTLRGSVVCDTGSTLQALPLPDVVTPESPGTLIPFDPAGCTAPVLVITNETQTLPNPSAATLRSYEVVTGADVTPPAPPSITARPAPFALGREIGAAWSTEDAENYEVQRSSAPFNGTFSGHGLWLSTTATSGAMTGTPGRTYCFRASAQDLAGNASPFGPESCTAIPADDRLMSRVGSWSSRSASGAYLGTYLQSRRQGSRLLLDGVRAKRLALIATRCRGCGTVKVFLGRQLLRKISLGATSTRRKQLIPVAMFASLRTGRVRIKVVSDGKPVRIEGLGVSAV